MHRSDDERLTAAFLTGRGEGLEDVYRAYGRMLYSIAHSVLANDEDAEDCVHDTLVRAWQHAGNYRSERGSLRAYLGTCVRNEAITRKRNAARHLRIEERVARSDRLTYDVEVDDLVERGRLRSALATLPPEQQITLALAYFAHLTHVEIADRLGLPLGTIKGRLRLALHALRGALQR